MKLQAQRENLLPVLQHLVSIIDRKQTWALLNNILIKAEDNGLRFVATDMEVELVANIQADVTDNGMVTLSSRKLMDICRNLPEESLLDIELSGNKVLLTSGKSRFNLGTMPPDEFPVLGSIEIAESVTVKQNELKDLIERTYFSMAQQDVRQTLNGLLLELTGTGARAVATDGHRLSLVDSSSAIKVNNPYQVILPRKGVQELLRLLSNSEDIAELQLGKKHLRVELDGMCMTSNLIEGSYPDYNRVFPSEIDHSLVVCRDSLRQAISRVMVLSSEKSRGVRLAAEEDALRVFSHNQEMDQEEATDEIEAEFGGELIEIGFNGSYILDALNAIEGEKVEILIGRNNSSGVFKGIGDESARYVIMPMRL
ncbi:DNA polymerase III subunit beta [Halorhodospira halochloris]|uniref:DNA polymerase III subunit beta n=1 Tax=Halorhodospira halochloris TaxID=1052 RepID=UPI00076F5E1E|nr:DNA polymerase III subunit beta [Halorhodospira halochloris]MBK1650830.1 DNA polymerase III subunit beta [Halorhodospira halochloris]